MTSGAGYTSSGPRGFPDSRASHCSCFRLMTGDLKQCFCVSLTEELDWDVFALCSYLVHRVVVYIHVCSHHMTVENPYYILIMHQYDGVYC